MHNYKSLRCLYVWLYTDISCAIIQGTHWLLAQYIQVLQNCVIRSVIDLHTNSSMITNIKVFQAPLTYRRTFTLGNFLKVSSLVIQLDMVYNALHTFVNTRICEQAVSGFPATAPLPLNIFLFPCSDRSFVGASVFFFFDICSLVLVFQPILFTWGNNSEVLKFKPSGIPRVAICFSCFSFSFSIFFFF